MTTQYITWYSYDKVDCNADCPVDVVICIPTGLIKLEEGSTFILQTILGQMHGQCLVDTGCGTTKYKIQLSYDDEQINEGMTLYASQITGVLCKDSCLLKYFQDLSQINFTVEDTESINLTLELGEPLNLFADVNISADAGNTITIQPDGLFVPASNSLTMGVIDSEAKSANGAVIDNFELIMQTADGNFPGLVSTGAQLFAGEKTFQADIHTESNIVYDNDLIILSDTVDGTDNLSLILAGGGGSSSARGALIIARGNEAGVNPGWLRLASGTVAGAMITLDTAGVTRLSVNQAGAIALPILTASLPLKLNASNEVISAAINLASAEVTGVLPIANGGTGASAVGTANQMLGVNAAGNALEYKALTANLAGDITNVGTINMVGATFTHVGLSFISNTVDGTDNVLTTIAGGGATTTTRGALVIVRGNETGLLPGWITLSAGDAALASLAFATAGLNRMVINAAGAVSLPLLTASLPLKLNASNEIISQAINLAGAEVTGLLPVANIAPGTNGDVLTTTGGVAVWAAGGGGISSIGPIDTQVKSADGAVIFGTSLVMQTADATNPGLVSATTQTIAGAKTLSGQLILGNHVIYTDANFTIQANTADAADTKRIGLSGGGAAFDSTRGGQVNAFGNEHATKPGYVEIVAGNVTGSAVTINSQISTGGLFLQIAGTTELEVSSTAVTIATNNLLLPFSTSNIISGASSLDADVTNVTGAGVGLAIVRNTSSNADNAALIGNGANTLGAALKGFKTRSASGTDGNTAVVTGDTLFTVSALGATGVAYANAARIEFACEGTIATGIVPGTILLYTANSSGTSTEAFRIKSTQVIQINSTAYTASLPLKLDASKNIISQAITLSGSEVTGTLPVSKGGTGTTFVGMSAEDIILGASSSALKSLPAGVNGDVLTMVAGVVAWQAAGSGLTNLNGLVASTQTFATGTTGTDFNISSVTSTHTFNIPSASATARGLITTGTQTIAGDKVFTDDVTAASFIVQDGGGIDGALYSDGVINVILDSTVAGNRLAFAVEGTIRAFFEETNGTYHVLTDINIESGTDIVYDSLASGFGLIIRSGSADGADNSLLSLAGGGTTSDARGASVQIHGNEGAAPGDLVLKAGNVAGGEIELYSGGSLRLFLNSGGNLSYTQTDFNIISNSADGSDNKQISINAGGATRDTARGAWATFYGNEHANTGQIIIAAGNVSGGNINLLTEFAGTKVVLGDNITTTARIAVLNTGDIQYSPTNFIITADTADASDTKAITISGGGATGSARGGTIQLFGNENAGLGRIDYIAGNISGGTHNFHTSGALKLSITTGGDLAYSATTFTIGADTSDASDTKSVVLAGGGTSSSTRGASISVTGNESADTGGYALTTGNVSGAFAQYSAAHSTGYHLFRTASTEALRIKADQSLQVNSSFYTASLPLKLDASKNVISQAINLTSATEVSNGVTTAYVGTTDTQTLTNKRITKRVVTTTDDATAVIDIDVTDQYQLTAMANPTTISTTGTPTAGQSLIIRLKDNGTARALTWDGVFRAIGVTLPTTTVISKTVYIGCIYNLTDTKWDAIAVAQEA